MENDEKNYRLLFEHMLDGFALHEIIYDEAGNPANYRFLALNPAFEKLTGLTAERCIGKTALDVLPKLEPFWIETYGKVVLTGEPARFENYTKALDKYFEVVAFRPQKDQFACVFHDVSAAKRTSAALKESKTLLNEAQSLAHLGHWRLNAATFEVEGSDELFRIFDVDREEATLDDFADAVHPEDRAYDLAHIQRGLEQGEPWDIEHRVVGKDGSVRFVQAKGRAVTDASGKVSRLVGTVQNITERKQLEAQLSQAHKMEAIGVLAGGIAHDFNNLLHSILGNTDVALFNTPKDSAAHEVLVQAKEAGLRARDLVGQILAFSRQSAQDKKPSEIQKIVTQAAKFLRSTISTTIKLNVQINENCGPVIADATQIHQVIMNLCTNAYQAMQQDTGEISIGLDQIEVGLEPGTDRLDLKTGPHARLSVADTGCGMDQATVKRIFEPYYTTKKRDKGTGLGLSTVFGIVKSHGGAINVESDIGKGSTFTVFLPISTGPAWQDKKDSELPRSPGTGQRVLFVDDDPMLASLGSRLLEPAGFRVTVQTDSTAALELFRKNPTDYDLVITDQTMPGMTGYQLSKKLLKIRPDIPIILCTGFSENMDRSRAQAVGIKDFIMKPFTDADLIQAIGRFF